MKVRTGAITLAVTLLTVGGCAAADRPTDTPRAAAEESSAAPSQTAQVGSSSSGGGDGACAMTMTLDGHEYLGVGYAVRNPVTTGETAVALIPGCNDTGGADEEGEEGEEITVHALRDVPLEQAFVWQGSILIRADQDPPGQLIEWRTPLPCDVEGQFEIAGDWVGLPPKRDGSETIGNPPYRMDVVVDDAPGLFTAQEYESVQFDLRLTETTNPTLDDADGKLLTTTGATFRATVHCEDSAYVADAVRVRER
jgi:hypothetical protein